MRYGADPNLGSMLLLHAALQGLKRFMAMTGSNTQCRCLPILSSTMCSLKRTWEGQGPDAFKRIMLWAVSCICFFGFLRSGEATTPTQTAYNPSVHLSISDVSMDLRTAPTSIAIRIKASKMDPFRLGITIHLGRTGGISR